MIKCKSYGKDNRNYSGHRRCNHAGVDRLFIYEKREGSRHRLARNYGRQKRAGQLAAVCRWCDIGSWNRITGYSAAALAKSPWLKKGLWLKGAKGVLSMASRRLRVS